jgi:hypothetical protein
MSAMKNVWVFIYKKFVLAKFWPGARNLGEKDGVSL